MRVVVVGRGRVGTALASLLGAATPIGRSEPIPAADVILVAVPESELPDVVRRLPAGVVALHTAGALSSEALAPHAPRGVFHPLMTFPGSAFPLPDLHEVPVRLAGDAAAVEGGRRVAAALGARVLTFDGDPRLYHAAAVIAGNFATLLLAEAATVLAAAGVDPHEAPGLLAPLALASIRNGALDPARALTGPAARNDRATLDAHRDALRAAGLTPQRAVYDLLSERASNLSSRNNQTERDTT